jgi:hypothetical protein
MLNGGSLMPRVRPGGLEPLTKPPRHEAEADQAGGEEVEAGEDVQATFIADGEAPEPAEPGQRPLDDPPIAAEPLAALDPTPGDPGRDAASVQRLAAVREVMPLVGVQLGRPLPWPADALPYRRHRLDQRLEELAVVPVCLCEEEGERDPVAVDEEVPLAAGPAAIRRVRSDRLAPFFAANDALSTAARLQSMAFALPRRSSSTRCSRAQTPAACQSRKRRQQVMPEPQPISLGK